MPLVEPLLLRSDTLWPFEAAPTRRVRDNAEVRRRQHGQMRAAPAQPRIPQIPSRDAQRVFTLVFQKHTIFNSIDVNRGVRAISNDEIDGRVYDLYDEYCHGHIDRRQFFERAAALAIGGVSALTMAEALLPSYAEAQVVSFTDERIKAKYVEYPSPGGTSGKMRGYLVAPAGEGPFPAILVIHENRGLNPYIEDVARRAAVAGFLALAPDGLSPIGGYPGNDDDGRTMQSSLDQDKLRQDMVNSALFLKSHELSNGHLGATGFCWGGSTTNFLATALGSDLDAGVPFYGSAPNIDDVSRISAAMMVQYAEDDPRVNATREDYAAALTANEVQFEMYTYPGTRHGFHNNSTPRYDAEAAELAWERTIAFFEAHLR
jgi:carboxymethylenebutenolidase